MVRAVVRQMLQRNRFQPSTCILPSISLKSDQPPGIIHGLGKRRNLLSVDPSASFTGLLKRRTLEKTMKEEDGTARTTLQSYCMYIDALARRRRNTRQKAIPPAKWTVYTGTLAAAGSNLILVCAAELDT